ncbi:MSC_0882 family membrane protein [Spiroplasma endosymbiont of Polydrusus pterygomalis]|uniref:MSC_0882 family membrane protein n=1 Tax=Spiroplasma endosymbiont of Polydrusus pterygomalis TaxID=3139327 RepID=UPI003CCA835F
MGFFNTVKSFMVKDKQHEKPPMQSEQRFGDNFNVELNQHNNSGFTENRPHPHNMLPNQYFRPNEAYKQNQLNNMEMLYQNNNTIHPCRMNLSSQYNYYANNNERQYPPEYQDIMHTTSPQMRSEYVEPYYNHDAAQNHPQPLPMQQQILSRWIQQYPPSANYDQYWAGPQKSGRYDNPEFVGYQNDHEGYENDDNYSHQYPYQARVTPAYNQMPVNDQFNRSEVGYDSKGYYRGANAGQYLDDNQMMRNGVLAPMSFYQKNHFAPSTQFEAPALTNNVENKRYAYQPQLSEKQRRRCFSKDYANRLIPLEIAREIRSEKVRTLIMIIVGFFGTMTTNLFIALYFISHQQELEAIMGIKARYIPHPFLTITFLLISLGLLFAGIFDLSRVRIETNSYLSNLMRGNHTIPHFLIDNYKKMTVRSIILSWLVFPTYFFGGIILGILYGFQQHSGEEFRFGFWSWGIVDDLTTAITITIIILIVTLGVHIANIVLTKKRKANIIGYYGYEIVRPEELAALKKKTNRICLVVFIIFLIILTLVISIPWLIARRRKRSGQPFLDRWFNRN